MDVVLHTTPCRVPSTVASSRIALYLAERLGLPLADDAGIALPTQSYERAFYVNSMGAFSTPEQRTFMGHVATYCKQLIYCQNDYTIHPISQTQKVMRARGWDWDFPFKKGPILWTTVPSMCAKEEDRYVNWNLLGYQPVVSRAKVQVPGLAYWGSFRAGRVPSFERYFRQDLYDVHMLAHGKVYGKFKVFGDRVVQGKQWKFPEELTAYPATVYIEDEKQHGVNHSIANRLYEALSAHMAVFVDVGALPTFNAAKLMVNDDWITYDAQDVAKRLHRAGEIANLQQIAWGQNFRAQLDKQVREAYECLPRLLQNSR